MKHPVWRIWQEWLGSEWRTRFAWQMPDALRPALVEASLQWRRSPLPAFLDWWGAGLLACLPRAWHARLARRDADRLLGVVTDPVTAERHLTHITPLTPLTGLSPWAGEPMRVSVDAPSANPTLDARVILLIPRAQVLIKTLRMPLAARDTLRAALGYDLDRLTPYRAEDVAFDARVRRSDAMLDVELVVMPHAALTPLCERIAAAGVALHGVDVVAPDGTRLGVNLLDPAQRAPHASAGRRLNMALGVALALLAGLACAKWQSDRMAALAAMQTHIDGMRAQALAVMRLRAQVRDQLGTTHYLSGLKRARPGLDRVLLQLTEALPDDSSLQQLEVDAGGALSLAGLSGHATAIVSRLQSADTLQDVRFQGVLEPDAKTHQDHFYLSARMKGDDHANAAAR